MSGTATLEMSASEAELWRELVGRRWGLEFPGARLRVLRDALRTRMDASRMSGYADYYRHLAFNPETADEWQELLRLLTNGDTCFFRHAPAFAALTGRVLPELRRRDERLVRMWSAGCSTGQEAYSLAMAFLEHGGRGWTARVCGSDVNPAALERARRGVYHPFEAGTLPEPYRGQYLSPVSGDRGGACAVSDDVRELVEFVSVNLSEAAAYPVPPQDVIFCHNVLIYFRPERRDEVVRRLCERLRPGGYLFLAPPNPDAPAGMRSVVLDDVLLYQRPA